METRNFAHATNKRWVRFFRWNRFLVACRFQRPRKERRRRTVGMSNATDGENWTSAVVVAGRPETSYLGATRYFRLPESARAAVNVSAVASNVSYRLRLKNYLTV